MSFLKKLFKPSEKKVWARARYLLPFYRLRPGGADWAQPMISALSRREMSYNLEVKRSFKYTRERMDRVHDADIMDMQQKNNQVIADLRRALGIN